MADLIELDVVVRDKGLKASISTVERLERQIIKAAKAVDQNTISQERYNKVLLSAKREYKDLGVSSQKATSTVRSFAAAQKKAAAESNKENSALKKLKSSYDSVYAAEQKRLRLKKLLRAEVAAGTMTLREAGRELLLYRKHLHETSQGFQFAKNRANKFGMVAQQVGYQVGDFFVQVQSGTSALVAFGQQGTQLAGLLPGVAGAVIGIGLSLGTMLLRTFLDTRDAGKQLEESIKGVENALSNLSNVSSMLRDTIGAPFSKANTQLKEYLELLEKSSAAKVQDAIALAFGAKGDSTGILNELKVLADDMTNIPFYQMEWLRDLVGVQYGPTSEEIANAEDILRVREEIAEILRGTPEQPRVIEGTEGLRELGDDLLAYSKQFNGALGKRIRTLMFEAGLTQLMVDAEKAKGDAADANTKKQLALIDDLLNAAEKSDAATNANLDAQLALQMKQHDEQLKIDALRDKESFRLVQEIRHAKYLNKFQMDKKEIAISLAYLARVNYELSLKEKQFTATEIVDLMKKYDLLQLEKAENDRILEVQKEKLKAQKELNKEVEKLAERLSIPFQRALELIRQAKVEATVGLDAFGGAGSFKYGGIQTYKPESSKGGKGAKPTTMEGPIKTLERQIELSKALFGLQGAARREEEIYMQLKFQNQDVDIKAGKEELELLAERVALEEQRTEAEQMNLKNISPLKKYVAEYAKLVKLKDSGLGDEAFAKEVAKLNKELAKSNPLLNSFTDAFADFLGRGARDFKSFAEDILNDFKNMLIHMITTAARNKIMFSMSMGGSALGTAAAAGGGGTGSSIANLGVLGNAVSSFAGSGIASGFSSALGIGGYAGQGLFNVVANAQVAVATGANAMAASIGAAIPPLLAVAAVFGMFRSRTKELDSGLRVTVDNMDVLVKSFKTIQKSKFFGLVKSVRTTEEKASSEVSDPVVNAVATIQESVMEAASAFGVASDRFDDFTYDFEVSLKGLTEDQKLEKLNEEFTKLGDSFTEMSGLFSNMNDLMAVYQQRLDLENQLLVAQGEIVKLRAQELETIHVFNRELASQLHIIQAKTDMQSALTAFASGISEQQGLIRRAVDALVKPLQDAIDRARTQAEKSYNIFKAAADKSADSAKNIVDIITSALDSRTIRSESAELMRYQTAQKQLASFAGGASFDEASLRRATEGVSIDSQKFFGSFEDYARDFYRTQINLEDLADVAEKELSEVEQQIDIAQKAYEVAMGTYQEAQDFNVALNNLISDLALYTEVSARNEPFIEQIKAEGDRQVQLLEQILEATLKAFIPDASESDLVGNIMSVANAMGILGVSESDVEGAVVSLNESELVGDIGSHIEDFNSSLTAAYDRLDLSLEDIIKLNLATPFNLVDLASAFDTTTNSTIGSEIAGPISDVNLATFFSELNLATPFSLVDLASAFDTITNSTIGSEIAMAMAAKASDVNLASAFDTTTNSTIGSEIADPISDVNLATFFSELNLATPFSLVDLSTPFSLVDLSTPFSLVDLASAFDTTTNSTIGSEMGGSIADAIKEAKITGGLEGVIGTLSSAIGDDTTGLGSIVSSLTSAISNLTGADAALVAAEQSETNAAAIAALTTSAAVVVGQIDEIETAERGAGTPTAAQKDTIAWYENNLQAAKSATYLPTGEYNRQLANAQGGYAGALAAVAPAEMSPEDSADLADLTADLEDLRKQIRDLGGTPTFSSGGYHSGGMRLVGENGPELEATGPSRIYSAQQTRNMLSGGSGEVVVELRSLRREVSELKAEQRKVGVENVKYNKKSYDLYREWDTVGLPATRTA